MVRSTTVSRRERQKSALDAQWANVAEDNPFLLLCAVTHRFRPAEEFVTMMMSKVSPPKLPAFPDLWLTLPPSVTRNAFALTVKGIG